MLSKRFKHAHFEVACRLNSPTAKAAARTPRCFDSKHPRTVFRSDCVFERFRLPTSSRLLLPRLNRTPIRVGGVGSETCKRDLSLLLLATTGTKQCNFKRIERERGELLKCRLNFCNRNTGYCPLSLLKLICKQREMLNEIIDY